MIHKVIVAGSRSIDDDKLVRDTIRESPHSPFHGELLVGDAEGVDASAKEQLEGFIHVEVNVFEADWEGAEHTASAGIIRNKKMVEEGDALIAIWDGESPGTKHTIDLALEHGLDVYVKMVDVEQSFEEY